MKGVVWVVVVLLACLQCVFGWFHAPKGIHKRVSGADALAAAKGGMRGLAGAALGGAVLGSVVVGGNQAVLAVSGGGKDFAMKNLIEATRNDGLVLEGVQKKYVGKDFSQVLAQEISFRGTELRGVRFYKAALQGADFTGADLSTASLEDAGLDLANFKDANLSGAYLSSSFEAVASIENADFTDALIPSKTVQNLCDRVDAHGTNPKTGVATDESLMCP